MASQRIVPGEPSGRSITNNNTPFHRLNDFAASSRPNNGCVSATTRTSHGKTARKCCSLSPSLQAPAKSHFCEALGQLAIDTGRTVAWFSIDELGALVRRHRADDSITKAIRRITRVDLIIVDDIGMLPIGEDAAEGFYRLVDACYETRSLAVSSNLHPAGFDELMPKTLATATVDRLLHHTHVCSTNGTQNCR